MGIDGIGGGGGPGGIGGPKPPTKVSGEGFKVEQTEGSADAQATGVSETESLEASRLAQLERGELSLDDYLGQRADAAVSHLQNKLSPEQLEQIRGELVEQMKTDPALSRLVQRATGVVPAPSEVDG